MLEKYEDVVEDWYFHHQDERLEIFLCQNHVLKESEQGGWPEERSVDKLKLLKAALDYKFKSL